MSESSRHASAERRSRGTAVQARVARNRSGLGQSERTCFTPLTIHVSFQPPEFPPSWPPLLPITSAGSCHRTDVVPAPGGGANRPEI